MVDNVTIPATGSGTATPVVATDDVAGVHYQFMKLTDGTLDSTTKIASGGGVETNALRITPSVLATATLTNLASTAASQSALASNTARRGVLMFNDDANAVLIKYGATASATSYTVKIPADSYWEMPMPIYTGAIDAIWLVDGSGSLRITELS
jgi:hypothetical protein